ncbi:hypothetical protein PGTUg99_013933 [Puccinia graminis f. sp. tritici]|uniref:Uncharacterized protein n=1 Tax=Puccinia graminis f. sp. tritici TaxID=56615 RepID=A0A5B0RA29_PUCGR|nr:hypothetical protein PGTUg99_013933 [Puccinia graminis f. sp. tritici]
MADTIDRGLDGLTLSVSEEDQLRRQGDLVIKSFRALGDDHLITNVRPDYPDKCPNHQVDPLDHQTEYYPDPPDSKSSLNRFHWPNRFQLSQQITSLSESLDPSLLRSQPGPTLELILEILSGICESLDQIKDAFRKIPVCPQRSSKSRLDDGHLRDFKDFRKIGLEKRIQDLVLRNQQLFRNSEDLILNLKLSSDEPKFPDEPDWIRERIIHYTADSSEATKRLIEWIEGSELDIVQHGWMSYMRSIDSALVVELERFKLSDTQRELAEHILPILKLSRLLLKKLSKRGLSGEEGIGSYTELSSKQRTSLLEFGSKLHMITMSAKNLFDFIA